MLGSLFLWLSLATPLGADSPLNTPPSDEFELLFNGKDFQHWLADPATLAHWRVSQGLLQADGAGPNLVSEKLYRNFELRVEFQAEKGSTGGVFLRGRPRVAIGDPAGTDPVTGGLPLNREHPSAPTARGDKPAGEWNSLQIEIVGDVVTVHLNDQLVVDKVVMENDFDRSRRIPVAGPIEFEAKGAIKFRNIYLRPLVSE